MSRGFNVRIFACLMLFFGFCTYAQKPKKFSQNFWYALEQVDTYHAPKQKSNYRSKGVTVGIMGYLIYSLYVLYAQNAASQPGIGAYILPGSLHSFGSGMYYTVAIASIAIKAILYKMVAQLLIYALIDDDVSV